jgi:serine/threonine protein kinase
MVKLCDFGLSHIMSSEYNGKALMTERCGTGGYIAPEIGSKNSIVGPEIDMWSFGVMLYEMCTAYKPTKLCNYRYGKKDIMIIFNRLWSYSLSRSRLAQTQQTYLRLN